MSVHIPVAELCSLRFLRARNSASTVSETGAYACTKLQIERIGISPTGAQRTGLSRHCAY